MITAFRARKSVGTQSHNFNFGLLHIISICREALPGSVDHNDSIYFPDIYLIPWSRVLPGKPTVTQLVKKFSAFYGNRRFITVFTRDHYWSLS